jgi:RecA-family ATPase
MGGDPALVHYVSEVKQNIDGNKIKRAFDPAIDLPVITQMLERLDRKPSLIVIDPIVMMTRGDSHKDAEVRRDLFPLQELMKKTGAAVVGIKHYNKNTTGRDVLERIGGSIAFGALPRLVIVVGKRKIESALDDGLGKYFLASIKHNVSGNQDTHTYNIVSKSIANKRGVVLNPGVIEWKGTTDKQAQELLDQAEFAQQTRKRDAEFKEVRAWLIEFLAEGPRLSNDVEEERLNNGYSTRTLRRAALSLGIVRKRRNEHDPKSPWVLMMNIKDDDTADISF